MIKTRANLWALKVMSKAMIQASSVWDEFERLGKCFRGLIPKWCLKLGVKHLNLLGFKSF